MGLGKKKSPKKRSLLTLNGYRKKGPLEKNPRKNGPRKNGPW